jgi:hypothetical protein
MSGQTDSTAAKITLKKLTGLPAFVSPALFDALNEVDLAECLFQALIEGNLPLFTAVWARRGPVSLEYQEIDGQGQLNGHPFVLYSDDVMLQCFEPADVKELFQTIHAYGIKGLIDAGPQYPGLFTAQGIMNGMVVARRIGYKGVLPFLDEGLLKSPELVVSLIQESRRSPAPEAYQPVLCWATEAMLAEYSAHLVPLRPLQRVEFVHPDFMDCGPNGTPVVFYESMSEFKAANRNPDVTHIKSIDLGFEDSPAHTEFTDKLLHYFCNKVLRAGFVDDDRVLCETRIDFLDQFLQIPSADGLNAAAAQRFIKHYFPLDIVGQQVADQCASQFGHDQQKQRFNLRLSKTELVRRYEKSFPSFFVQLGAANEMGQKLLDLMTQAQWRGLIDRANTLHLWAKSVIAFRDALDMSNEGLQIKMLPEDCVAYHEAGYQFSSVTRVFDLESDFDDFRKSNPRETSVYLYLTASQVENHLSNNIDTACSAVMILNEARKIHAMVQSMNLWTSQRPKPSDVQSAMDEICRYDIDNPDIRPAMALSAYLQTQGVDACVKAAKTPMHWQRIVELFSAKETRPYLKQMPASARGRVLEDSMGL